MPQALQRADRPAWLDKTLEAADRSVARIDPAVRIKIVEHAVTMVGPERDPVTLGAPPILVDECRQYGHHVHIAVQAIHFVDAEAVSVALRHTKMGEVDARSKAPGHGGKIVLRVDAEVISPCALGADVSTFAIV